MAVTRLDTVAEPIWYTQLARHICDNFLDQFHSTRPFCLASTRRFGNNSRRKVFEITNSETLRLLTGKVVMIKGFSRAEYSKT